ncbi:unnamed protein product [Brachionus calyciflorus]|uniref:RNA (guanine-9-)-methyltransferase domain-containing protein 1 n=1 Tax=Brachionus calyciflorus TaxID=104777 RepID=A0A813TWN5_9BILA|nr:unnamed protein product [Brachionus calyciflorus]
MNSNIKILSIVRLLSRQTLGSIQSKQFSIYSRALSPKFEDDDWFKKLTNTNTANLEKPQTNDYNQQSQYKSYQKYHELSPEEKKEAIQNLWTFRKENGLPVPKILTEYTINELLKCESFSHLKKSMIHLVKEEFYAYQKEQKKLEKLKRAEIEDKENNSYTGTQTYLKPVGNSEIKDFNRKKVLSSIITNEPSIVFDFRYLSLHTRIEHKKSIYRQFIEIINENRSSKLPFQIHFCNYDSNSDFHQRYAHFLEFDKNLINDTPKSYLDIFPKNKLVYLSRDAKVKMTSYDPDNVYIIGSIIDTGDDKFKYVSYSQAKKDGIRCERLPLDDYVKWNRGQKSLNMDHIFNIFLQLKHGKTWQNALQASLPKRKFNEILNEKVQFRRN